MLSDECVCWGRSNTHADQGWAIRLMDRRYWLVSWSALFDTHERDGKMRYQDAAWMSENGKFISMPYAIVDDFGCLRAVEI